MVVVASSGSWIVTLDVLKLPFLQSPFAPATVE